MATIFSDSLRNWEDSILVPSEQVRNKLISPASVARGLYAS
ncbi:hypothetical protein GXM_08730 [Nostoc sphaeroides CCNUC1]|uniref:Uncharacterized protein n=1 Tax=Nostoc sphaeroides CCNUC1 TaxID=2653204 RepID=A0A5P8WGD3_9NOSO|nr:hypothetical protein GXM_08730 [Nostoc sphaeroides CCNUC1]